MRLWHYRYFLSVRLSEASSHVSEYRYPGSEKSLGRVAPMEGKTWYNLDVAEVVSSLGSNAEGLTSDGAKNAWLNRG